jgi:hypothetical protein
LEYIGWPVQDSGKGYVVSASYKGPATTVQVASEPEATQHDAGSEFQRFEHLAGKLVAVPKPELDEKRKTT